MANSAVQEGLIDVPVDKPAVTTTDLPPAARRDHQRTRLWAGLRALIDKPGDDHTASLAFSQSA